MMMMFTLGSHLQPLVVFENIIMLLLAQFKGLYGERIFTFASQNRQ